MEGAHSLIAHVHIVCKCHVILSTKPVKLLALPLDVVNTLHFGHSKMAAILLRQSNVLHFQSTFCLQLSEFSGPGTFQ